MGNRWLWALGLLLVLAVGAVYFWMQPQLQSEDKTTRILLLGLDEVDNRSRSDTIIVVQVDEQGVVLLSVPRDLRVKIPKEDRSEFGKINAAYAQGAKDGNVRAGANLARQVVSDFLGVSIPYYVVVDFKGFKTVVDQLGGVEIDVESSMNYDDDAQNLHIQLEPGLQTLNGEQALQYARFRDGGGDLRRIQRQQKLLRAILSKQKTLGTFDQIKTLVSMAFDQIKATNLPLPNLISLAQQLQNIDLGNTVAVRLEGRITTLNGISYLEPNTTSTAALVDRWLRREDFLLSSDIRLIVLNGKGQQGLASSVKKDLSQEGFNVICADNAESLDYLKTYVVTMQNSEEKAKLVSDALQGTGQIVHKEVVSDHLAGSRQNLQVCAPEVFDTVDVVLILGQDFSFP